MNKLKTHKASAKRFLKTANAIKFRRTGRSHINTKISAKKKRQRKATSHSTLQGTFKQIRRLL